MIKPVIALFLAYQLVVDAQCTGCWIGTSGPCKQSNGVCWASNNNRCPQGTTSCRTPATPEPSSTPLPGSDCLDCFFPSSGKCKAPHDGVCHAEMPGNPENDNCPPGTNRCYPQTLAPVTPAPITPAPVTPAPITPAPVTPAPITPAPVTPAPTPATVVIFTEDFTDSPGRFADGNINDNGRLLIKKKEKAQTSLVDIRNYSEVQFSFDYGSSGSKNLKVGYKFNGSTTSWTYTRFAPTEERVTGSVSIAIPDNSRQLKFRFKGGGNTNEDRWRIDNVSVTGTEK